MKQVCVTFVASYEAAKVLQPANRAFDFPPATVSSQFSTVLCGRLGSVAAVRTNQFNATSLQACSQGIAVGSSVVDQVTRLATKDALAQERFNERYFMRAGAGRVDSQWKPVGVDENHDLGSLAAFCPADLFAPFFADENVPSAIDSSCLIEPCRSSVRKSRPHACSQIPASVHAFRRRQQVEGEGKRLGRSFQRAPVRRIQMIPSTQGLGGCAGRPPFGPTFGAGKNSEIRFHCSSVSSYSCSVMDPEDGSTAKQDRFPIDVPPFGCTLYGKQTHTV